jgi:lysozyme
MGQFQANKGKIISAGVLAAAAMIAIPFIGDQEGDKLDSYEDVVGVWTVCEGVTGPQVKPGLKMTKSQCDALDKSKIGQFMTSVASKLTVAVSPETLAAHTSFAYNIGIAGYARSKTLKLTNAGKIKQGCEAMANWETAGGLDCNVRENGCYGLVERRDDEINLCLGGVK